MPTSTILGRGCPQHHLEVFPTSYLGDVLWVQGPCACQRCTCCDRAVLCCGVLWCAGHEKLIRVYDLERPDADPRALPPSKDSLRTLLYMPDNATLLASYVDKPSTDVLDMRSGEVVRSLDSGGAVTCTEVTPCGRYIVTADGQQVCIRDAASFDVLRTLTTPSPVEAASYCPERGRLVAGGADMWVHLYDVTQQDAQEIDCCKGHHGPVHCVRFAPGGSTYASGSEDGTIRIWQTDFVQQAAALQKQQEQQTQQQQRQVNGGAATPTLVQA